MLSKVVGERLTVMTSRNPSALKSPTAIPEGLTPTVPEKLAAKLPVPPPVSSTTWAGVLSSATTRSILPSRLKSPTARVLAHRPVATSRGAWKVRSPLPSRMVTPLASSKLSWATARSSFPSLLKSAPTTLVGRVPTANVVGAPNRPLPLLARTEMRLSC